MSKRIEQYKNTVQELKQVKEVLNEFNKNNCTEKVAVLQKTIDLCKVSLGRLQTKIQKICKFVYSGKIADIPALKKEVLSAVVEKIKQTNEKIKQSLLQQKKERKVQKVSGGGTGFTLFHGGYINPNGFTDLIL